MNNTGDSGFTSRPESVIGDDLIAEHFGEDDRAVENITVHSPDQTVDSAEFRAVVDATVNRLEPWRSEFTSFRETRTLPLPGSPRRTAWSSRTGIQC